MALLYLVPSAKDSYLCLAGMHMCPAFTPRLTLKGGRTSPKLPRMQGQSSFVSCGMLADHLMQVIGLCSACTAMYELYPKAHGVIKAMCFFKQTARLHGQNTSAGCPVMLGIMLPSTMPSMVAHEQCAAAGMDLQA